MGNAVIFDTRLERMSLEQWALLAEDEPGEIVAGYRVEEEVPENVHELVVAWLIRVLGTWGVGAGAIVLGSGAKSSARAAAPHAAGRRNGASVRISTIAWPSSGSSPQILALLYRPRHISLYLAREPALAR